MALSDTELVARVLAHDDRHAFAEIVRRYQSPVRLWLRRMTSDPALSDDLAQETFLRLFRHLKNFRGDSKLSTFLYRIAYNLFSTEYQKRKRQPEWSPLETEPHESLSDHSDLRRDLERALLLLPESQRAAIVLTCIQGVIH